MSLCALGISSVAFAQEATETAVEGGMYQALKTKFIEGGADFMSLVAIALIFGLAFCLERIIYLNLAETNSSKLLKGIEDALDKGDVEGAKAIARDTRGPIASIAYQGLMRIDQGIDVVEKSIVSYGGVQGGLLEKNMSWITLFIAMAPSLGFLGTVVGMIMAFDKIEQVGDISPTVVAGGMKVALITTVGGLIVALILQIFYNYLLSKLEAILNQMEDASITLLDLVIKYNLKFKKQETTMAVTKIRKMSSWTLLIVSLISIVVLGMFFGGGITNPGEEMKEYVYTGLLLNWTSALFFVTIICMVLFAVWQFITLLKVNPKSALSALGVVVAFVAMLFITYSIGDGTPLQGLNADSQKYNTAGWLQITDMWIWSTVVLLVLIVACVVWGSVKRMLCK